MITIDYIGRGGLEKTQKWLRNTWTAPKAKRTNVGPVLLLVHAGGGVKK